MPENVKTIKKENVNNKNKNKKKRRTEDLVADGLEGFGDDAPQAVHVGLVGHNEVLPVHEPVRSPGCSFSHEERKRRKKEKNESEGRVHGVGGGDGGHGGQRKDLLAGQTTLHVWPGVAS